MEKINIIIYETKKNEKWTNNNNILHVYTSTYIQYKKQNKNLHPC